MRYLRWRRPGRTMRMRLTLLYAGLFLGCAFVLLMLSLGAWQHSSSVAYAVPVAANGVQPAVAPDQRALAASVAVSQHRTDVYEVLVSSALALAVTGLLSLGLGWAFAGRALKPLRVMTAAVRSISATSLHQRLRMSGPADELRELGDTFDGLLGRLERSFELQRQFVANASHELRTPLTTMRASLDVAVAKPAPVPPQLVALADGLRQDLDQMDRLLDGLLTLARAQRGVAAAATALALDELAAAALARQMAGIAGLALRVDHRRCPAARVVGNETLLARMVGNLVDNAVAYNVPDGWIRIATALAGDRVRLTVENGGPVLAQGAARDLVQPFRRLGTPRTGSERGTGLGLTIVASVAEMHGGTLALDALPTGGLRATVTLPLAAGSGA